jgi:hypothetical protein
MQECETLDLLKIEASYLKFIVETITELNLLEHMEICKTCRTHLIEAVEKDQHIKIPGNLFLKQCEEKSIPQFNNYKESKNFIDARIQWRKLALTEIIKNADIELMDLRNRIDG